MGKSRQFFLDKANELLQDTILVDGHIDFPWRLSLLNYRPEGDFLSIPIQSNEGDFDYVRAKAGGLSAPFMAIYVAADFQKDLNAAREEALRLIAIVESIIALHPDKFGYGYDPEMISDNYKRGIISLPMGLENGAPLAAFEDVDLFFNKGIRYVTLTHSKDNHICDSSYDTSRTWKGLSLYGKDLVCKMNGSGMIIDVSHVSDDAFYEILKLSRVPVLATHSSCRAFIPGWERNMDDDMIRALAQKGGVIQINFGSDFLDEQIAKKRAAHREALKALLAAENLNPDDKAALPLVNKFREDNPPVYSDVEKVADHFEHVKNMVGTDHLGIGSDFDGLGDSLPVNLKDVSMYPQLIASLLARDFTDSDIRKICHDNVFRVWTEALQFAGKA